MTASVNIHPTAIVHANAKLDLGVEVGAYAIIDEHVTLGKNTKVHSHALVTGHTTLGEDNVIYSYASVGNVPQDLKYKGEPTTLEIGNKNIIREYVTMQPGTLTGISTTKIGHGNLFMAYVHIAHDCIVGNNNIFANLTQLSGHVIVGDKIVFGGMTAIHQFTRIGDYAMTGGAAVFGLDLPPFCVAEGNRAGLRGLNTIGLQRAGFNPMTRAAIKKAYKILFVDSHPTTQQAIASLSDDLLAYTEVKMLVDFILNSKRGVMRPFTERRLHAFLNESVHDKNSSE